MYIYKTKQMHHLDDEIEIVSLTSITEGRRREKFYVTFAAKNVYFMDEAIVS